MATAFLRVTLPVCEKRVRCLGISRFASVGWDAYVENRSPLGLGLDLGKASKIVLRRTLQVLIWSHISFVHYFEITVP